MICRSVKFDLLNYLMLYTHVDANVFISK